MSGRQARNIPPTIRISRLVITSPSVTRKRPMSPAAVEPVTRSSISCSNHSETPTVAARLRASSSAAGSAAAISRACVATCAPNRTTLAAKAPRISVVARTSASSSGRWKRSRSGFAAARRITANRIAPNASTTTNRRYQSTPATASTSSASKSRLTNSASPARGLSSLIGGRISSTGRLRRSSPTRQAPYDLSYAQQDEDRAVGRPLRIVGHEAVEKGDVEALEYPDPSHADQQHPEEGADCLHHDVERGAHRSLLPPTRTEHTRTGPVGPSLPATGVRPAGRAGLGSLGRRRAVSSGSRRRG